MTDALYSTEVGDLHKIYSITGANLDATDKSGMTPVLLAVCNNHFEVVDVLLGAGDVIMTRGSFIQFCLFPVSLSICIQWFCDNAMLSI